MKLTRYGFWLDLLRFLSLLSFSGIVVSIIGIMGGSAYIWRASQTQRRTYKEELGLLYFVIYFKDIFYAIGGILLILMIPYLIMWILLKIKTRNQEMSSIEKIGTVYSYVSGSLEIIAAIGRILLCIALLSGPDLLDPSDPENIGYIIGSLIFLIFACLKILGISFKNIKLLGTYLGFRYALFTLYLIASFVLSVLHWRKELVITALIVGIVYFILDIGLLVILHSIRVDRKKNAGTENQMETF